MDLKFKQEEWVTIKKSTKNLLVGETRFPDGKKCKFRRIENGDELYLEMSSPEDGRILFELTQQLGAPSICWQQKVWCGISNIFMYAWIKDKERVMALYDALCSNEILGAGKSIYISKTVNVKKFA